MDDTLSKYALKLSCGAIAGIIGTTAIFPLDLIKTRLQVSPIAESPFAIATNILKTRGVFGLYSGLSANLLGVTPEKAIKLVANDGLRELLAWNKGCTVESLPNWLGAVAGGGAGVAQFVVTCPMEAVKIKMQLCTDNLWKVINALGIRGMYKGGAATLLRDIPFSMLLFQLNAVFRKWFKSDKDLAGLESVMAAGLLAGAVAALAATPMDVVKTRIQAGRAVNILDSIKLTYNEANVAGFFKGSPQRVAIVAPLFGISLLAYEAQQRMLFDKKKD